MFLLLGRFTKVVKNKGRIVLDVVPGTRCPGVREKLVRKVPSGFAGQ